jgi:hypothetical protein
MKVAYLHVKHMLTYLHVKHMLSFKAHTKWL